ncbi:MAG: L,D-transpeptidase [Bosea sp.]|uniref:L,D-transpeptidase n=1 Tax=Bosea sp. (in: a-proteobacteria) TaxID=1871050 RepID=UPI001AD12D05|nr:L,D-transpeptidase [Bosea sp. (in: a-proteobacteria)]MBN9453697.1 L,D-transpeptidase [Bosea sp. (in: a-proteobacteria)]
MRRVLGILAVLFLSAFAGTAHAGVDVRVDIVAQRMTVTTTDGEVYDWKISSGRKGFRSPNGVYRPTRLEKNWYSRKYGGAMPHSVFFRGGYAIHGTTAVGALGRPASHGCIRLHPANAAKLFALVKKYGSSQTRIALNGAAPDNLSRFAKASSPTKAKLAKASPSKHKIAKAKQRSHAISVAQRRGGNWEAARGQILLRPALPAGAYGYQPYYPSGYGWR